MYYFLVVFFFIHSSFSLSIGRAPLTGCQIDQQTDDNATLIVDNTFAYKNPIDATVYVKVSQNADIYTTCPGGKFEYNKHFLAVNYLHVKCVSGNNFIDVSSSTTFDFSKLFCNVSKSVRPTVEVTKTSSVSCGANKGKETQLGYNFKYFKDQKVQSKFAKLITVCFDDMNKIPLYSSFTMNGWKRSAKVSFDRADKFSQRDSYYGDASRVNLANFYSTANQQATFNKILGASKIIITQSNRLSKGHLTANADFPYKLQRDATFHYDNTAPQWLSFNNGNWALLEEAVRNYVQSAASSHKSQTIYTGTLDVATSKDTKGVVQQLYLDLTNRIPVPKWFWKLVDYTTAHYIFFGYNDLYSGLTNKTDVENELIRTVCTQQVSLANIPQMSNVIKFNNDLNKGYIFACDWNKIRHAQLKAIIQEIQQKKFYNRE